MPNCFTTAAATLLLMASAATAQTVLSGNHSVDGNLCVGPDCSGAETFPGSADIKLNSFDTRLLFQDSSSASGAPTTDWELRANDAGSGFDYFAIRNADTDIQIFRLDDGAPANSLYVADNGLVGFGTSLPTEELHVISQNSVASIRLEETLNTNGSWTINASNGLFSIVDDAASTAPVFIDGGAPTGSIKVEQNGYVGIGTSTPGAPLTVSTPDTFSFFRIEALGAPVNTSADMTFTAGPTNNGEFRINVVDGDGPEMRVDAEGYVIATTGFRVNNTTLAVPDYVFEPDYALRPLAEVQAFIETNKHLPDVPSAAKIAADGLDMTDMQMTLLKKVEELTLYTLELEAARAAQDDRIARLEALLITPEHPIAE